MKKPKELHLLTGSTQIRNNLEAIVYYDDKKLTLKFKVSFMDGYEPGVSKFVATPALTVEEWRQVIGFLEIVLGYIIPHGVDNKRQRRRKRWLRTGNTRRSISVPTSSQRGKQPSSST